MKIALTSALPLRADLNGPTALGRLVPIAEVTADNTVSHRATRRVTP